MPGKFFVSFRSSKAVKRVASRSSGAFIVTGPAISNSATKKSNVSVKESVAAAVAKSLTQSVKKAEPHSIETFVATKIKTPTYGAKRVSIAKVRQAVRAEINANSISALRLG